MIIHDCIQGSPQWFTSRIGIPTASKFEKIITPANGKASTQADGYQNELIAEILAGRPLETFKGNMWTERGKELEEEAVKYYEFIKEVSTVKIGFATDDDRTMGCSPDRLVGDDGLLEIKVLAPHTHVAYLLSGKTEQEHRPQTQGQLMVTGRKWVDTMAYFEPKPEMSIIVRSDRDEIYITTLRGLITDFTYKLQQKLNKLREAGIAA